MSVLLENGRLTGASLALMVKHHDAREGRPYMASIAGVALNALVKELQARRATERRPETGSVVHIAGHGLCVGSQQRQACAWCGFLLLEEDYALTATIDGRGAHFWPEGELVEVSASSITVLGRRTGVLPDNCCAASASPKAPPPKAPALRVVR